MLANLPRALGAAVLLCFSWLTTAEAAQTVRADHVVLDISLEKAATSGKTVWAAIRQTIEPGWHTYWRNPGDSGLATSIAWTLPRGAAAGAPLWPAPERFTTGPIVNFGYRGVATLLVPLTLSRDAKADTAQAKLFLLECAQMCIPEQVTLDLDLRTASGAPGIFASARAALPSALHGASSVTIHGKEIQLTVIDARLNGVHAAAAIFYPATVGVVDYDAPSRVKQDGDTLLWRAALKGHRTAFASLDGVLVIPRVGAIAISAPLSSLASLPAPASVDFGLIEAALMAFLGGLILNLMPCVLPILSMKALSLAQSEGNVPALRRDGLAYLAGVLVTFMGIAGSLLALKAGGAALGWGFQLQSPLVVFALALLMVAIGLNLLGAFEIPLSLAGIGDHLTRAEGGRGAFFTGVLAVLVASPCTAPFMGSAVGYALTQSGVSSVLIFLALGTGFALPFTALAFAPAVVRLIPKPGNWMLRFKEVLAFPMFATAIWLIWVLSEQVGSTGLAIALTAGLCLVFLLWLLPHLGLWSRRLAGVLGLAAFTYLALQIQTRATPAIWAPWSAAAVASARDAGHPVLVDFSAAWCVTCLVNERVALANDAVLDGLRRDGVVLLKADWTNRSAEISAELDRHGRSGVPLYLLYRPGSQGEAEVLPQILTPNLVLTAIDRARTGNAARRLSSEP